MEERPEPNYADVSDRPLLLWVDDEKFALTNYKTLLERRGFRVNCAYTFSDGVQLLDEFGSKATLAIIDIMLPLGEHVTMTQTQLELAKGGYEAGALLIQRVRDRFPALAILVYSSVADDEMIEWLTHQRVPFVAKTRHFRTADEFVDMVRRATAGTSNDFARLRTFIVHGHDDAAKWELKNYLQNVIGLPEPLILHERGSHGRTIIEKFEEEASDRNLVFVLMTPDDHVDIPAPTTRSRQNVIFELGYFIAKFGRRDGRVILLHKACAEIPSDLAGVVYIDITTGIEAAGEQIRREIRDLLELA